MRGLFVTLEGIEGSGKTTQARLLADALSSRGHDVALTREPGGSRAGETIRTLFLDPAIALSRTAEFLLVLADRAQHVAEHLRPALQRGRIVVSDRYSDSTTAYQGYGRGFDLKLVAELNRLAVDAIAPDITFLLDCPVEVGLERTRTRHLEFPGAPDRFERERIDFHHRVREGFRAIAQAEPRRVRMLDSTRPLEEVRTEILQNVISLLDRR